MPARLSSPRRLLSRPRPLATSPPPPTTLHNTKRKRYYSSTAPSTPNARLNLPLDYARTPLLHHTSKTALAHPSLPPAARNATTQRMNLFQAINSALATALAADPRVLLFGEDVAFGGVFRCTTDLALHFGGERVFNTPLTEQGIVGFALGAAAEGLRPVAEIQFADYVYPAFDQLVNEAAKWRYREGADGDGDGGGTAGGGGGGGGLVVRMPCGGVGHGALYHSQSPESLFTHVPGLRVVVPRGPWQAKGLLLEAILGCNDPVVFLEPKILYRAAVEQVPSEAYRIPLSTAEVVKQGRDVTVVSYGAPMYNCERAVAALEKESGCSVELVDLRTVYPWDRECVVESVKKTGRAVVVHESMLNAGVGAEVAATIQEKCFLRLEAPVQRVTGWSTHCGLIYERFNMPDIARIYDAIKTTINF